MLEKKFETIAEMFISVTNKYAGKTAFGYKVGDEWKTMTFVQVREMVEKISSGLKSLGIKPGDHVGIISHNSHLWAMSDYATVCARGVLATIYPTLTTKQVKWIVQHAECRFIFAGDQEQAEKVLSFLPEAKQIEKVIVLDNTQFDDENVILLSDLLDMGEKYRSEHPDEFERDAMSIHKDDVLTMIYTSGTTGEPKGVMLTHGNLSSNIAGSLKVITADENDRFLSFLPLSHVFERMAGHYLATSVGAAIYYAESINTVADNMGEIHPTLMTAVPRFYEKVYSKIIDNISTASSVKQKLFWWSINGGKKAENLREQGRPVGVFLETKLKIANKLVFSKLQAKVGGKLRFFASGGAPLSKEIGKFFKAAGISILEGYGLTETSPVISINPLEKNKLGTVGPILSNVEVKIADDGEILTRGPHIMKGYFKNDEATAEVIDKDGWFYTGDIGMFDEDGYLAITDRKKNIIVTSGGKNVAPQPMENVLVTSKWIEQILAIGDRRKFVSAFIVPSFPNLETWAKDKELKWETRDELIKLPEVGELYDRVIEESMEGFAQFEKVKRYILLPQEFTIESGELTPSMKIRRNIVEKKYQDMINRLYSEAE
ncbi:long-chain fatty acid--CoA ligase [bacterium]|nr:long-chain fatty acid--CoA ligase [bacterium]MBU1633960.1 long-chain fatty acid--CoA ligase [bacterium]MBU1875188.1 long-chain fatty acid--CoA ligase [bacterium]